MTSKRLSERLESKVGSTVPEFVRLISQLRLTRLSNTWSGCASERVGVARREESKENKVYCFNQHHLTIHPHPYLSSYSYQLDADICMFTPIQS